MLKPLENKNILFFSPAFFNYEESITEKMESMGANVVFYDERAINTAFERALLKIIPTVFQRKANAYYDTIIEKYATEQFDYILIVKCDMVTKKTLKKLKKMYPKAKLCLHLWDSVDNIPNVRGKIGLFDFATSFDRNDCNEIEGLIFRPLFYAKEFEMKDTKSNIDIAFCGTIHSDRHAIILAIKKWCRDNGRKFYSFSYLQSKFIYYFYKFTKKSFRNTELNDFAYSKKSLTEISEIEAKSKAILDIQHPKQIGLTMRTIEMIGMGKKLITTNKDIVNYDLYDPANIYVIERNNPIINEDFLDKPVRPLNEEIRERYSLDSWVLDVLGENR